MQRQTQNSINYPVAMMVNMSKAPQSAPSSYIANKFSDRSSPPVQECSHCHIKRHTKNKCYKLVGYPLDYPYHPNNKGQHRFTLNSKSLVQSPIMQESSVSSYKSPITPSHEATSQCLTTKMDTLRSQLNSIMQFLNKKV